MDMADLHAQTWVHELVGLSITASGSEQQLLDCVKKGANFLGFEFFCYGLQAGFPLNRQIFTWLHNHPDAWESHYESRGYPGRDPRIKVARCSLEPFGWHKDLFNDNLALWADLDAFGMQHGWTQPIRSGSAGFGMLSLSRGSEPVTKHEISVKLRALQWFAQLAHEALSNLVLVRVGRRFPPLTQREQEVIRWTADGKSALDISDILQVSKSTVDYHINNVLVKLNASNKTSAAVMASSFGLLTGNS